MKWSICIASVPERRNIRRRLLAVLEPQVSRYDDIELLIFEDNLKRLYGEKLQSLVDIAKGQYVNFVDDDDLVSESYVDKIYEKLDGVDCIGFKGLVSVNESPTLPVSYSIHNEQENLEYEYRRFVQHLNPIKRDLILRLPYEGHDGADTRWSEQIRELGLLKTEHYIDDILYYYISDTENQRDIWLR